MRRWLISATSSARLVADRPELWLPGALAWIAGLGWMPLLLAVVPAPSIGDLTFLGARLATSGAWPWNLVLIGVVLLGLAVGSIILSAAGEATLHGLAAQRRPRPDDTWRIAVIHATSLGPTGLLLVAAGVWAAAVAPGEVNTPDSSTGPIVRILGRLAPLLIAAAMAVVTGSAYAAVASRLAVRPGFSLTRAMRAAPGSLRHAGGAAVIQVLAVVALRITYLLLATLLLIVLWEPIGAQLATDAGIDLAPGLLLVGFVAIWLCLVLGGGALHAWGSASWTLLLAEHEPGAERKEQTTQT